VSRTGTFEEFLSRYSPAVKVLAFETRSLIRRLIPEAFEMVDAPSKIVAYGYSPKYADLICAIAPYRTYINLIFSRGTELSDPDKLLIGTGKQARHVKIDSPKLVENAGLEALIKQSSTLIRN